MQLMAVHCANRQGDFQPQEDGLCWTQQLSLNCPLPATLCRTFPTVPAQRIPCGGLDPLESQAQEAATVASAIPAAFDQTLGSTMQCHPSAENAENGVSNCYVVR